jgi:murein DD-endopeptidase MepM/ murein hydrolase activator NlpD
VNLFAIWDGTVISTCNGAGDFNQAVCGACGNSIEIQHNTVKVLYCHITSGSHTVKTGQRVARAQKIGVMGTSGQSTGVHLHVQVREINNGALRDIRTRLGLNGWRTC